MTIEPRPSTPVLPSELRSRVRDQASKVSSHLVVVAAGLAAVFGVLIFVLLDYRLDQDAHRLIKIVAALPVALGVVLQPTLGLLVFPVMAPFLVWLPQLPLPGINTLNAMLLGVFGAWFVMRVMTRRPIARRFWLVWPMIAVVGIMTVSLFRAIVAPPQEYDAVKAFILLFRNSTTFIPYFITVLMVRNGQDSRRVYWAVVVGLIAESIATFWFGEWSAGGRAKGTMGQPNALGAYLSISTVLVGSVLLAQRNWFAKLVSLAAVVIGAYAAVQTISRGAMISVALGLSYVAVRSSRLLTVMVALALLTSPIWAPESVKERVLSTQQQDEDSDEVELEGSAQARIDTWKATMDLASHHWFDGVGLGVLPYILIDHGKKMGLGHTHESTHNSFLRMLGEMGIPGLIAYVILLAACWALGMAGLAAAGDRFERQLAIGLQGALISVGINCWFGDRFFELDIMCAFWMVCALVNDFVNRATVERA
jgi:hypothetical protein